MIKTVNLQKVYVTEDVETTALNNVNVEITEGEFVAIMGPSGCGKSTLLNILGLLDNPSSGEYYINGEEVAKHTERERANTRKQNIGFVFQSFKDGCRRARGWDVDDRGMRFYTVTGLERRVKTTHG